MSKYKPTPPDHRPVIQAAEKEFGQPFTDIVKGFADMGLTIRQTAEAIGYSNPSGLYVWVRRNNVKHWFVPGKSSASDYYRAAQSERSRKMWASMRDEMVKRRATHFCEHDGLRDTLKNHALRLGIAPGTVYHRRRRNPNAGPSNWLRPVWSGVGASSSYQSGRKDNHVWRGE